MIGWPKPSIPVYLDDRSLDWALNHAKNYGDTVFFPEAFEYLAIEQDWANIKQWLKKQDLREWKRGPYRRFLALKQSYSYRFITQLDPLEYLVFTALLYSIGPQLEAIRIPKDQEIVFSWRFKAEPNGRMYDPLFKWVNFNNKCLELARKKEHSWVIMADIADFFSKIYFHPLEQAVAMATSKSDKAYCLLQMIKNWNEKVSYGLPVGLAGSRIIAEATIDDVDKMLLGMDYKYCRYADDFRIFCTDEASAVDILEELTSFLFDRHGLTLQPIKTAILETNEYIRKFDISPEKAELESLTAKFSELLEEAGIEDDYETEIDYDSLSADLQEEIDNLNLESLFKEQLKKDKQDPFVISFILYRLGQLNNDNILDDILANIAKLQPVMHSVVQYIIALRDLSIAKREKIGKKIIEAAENKILGKYTRASLLSIFTHSNEFDNESAFERLYKKTDDLNSRRKLVLALGRAKKEHWFLAQKKAFSQMDPWTARAFLAAFSCVNKDAREPFYRSVQGKDVLWDAIIKWVKDNPF